MKPIALECRAVLPMAASEFASEILDLANWSGFRRWGPIPGIESATFELQTNAIVGSRIHVVNQDGSTHVEVITDWQPDNRLQLKMIEFSEPLSRLASHFEETWMLKSIDGGVEVRREIRMFATGAIAWLPLWIISRFLKRAIVRHLSDLSKQANNARSIAR